MTAPVPPVVRAPRRRPLRWLAAAVALVLFAVLAFGGWVGWSFLAARVDTVGEVEFDRPLAIPPLDTGELDDRGRRVFDLRLQRGETDLGRERPTPTWGVNGSYLGPTLRAARGEEVVVKVENDLGETSTLHWHGMHLPAAMDGGPHQMIGDGETWTPSWRIDQPAATLWYHPHPHGATAEHVYRGVAGVFLLDEDPGSPQAALQERLPHTYGVDDVPLVVQDKAFDGHELDTSPSLLQGTGLLGDTVLVNGTPGPYLDVTTELVRLRVVNASNARVYDFHLDDGSAFDVVGSDGGLLPAPVRTDHLELSPGERAEVVVALEPGETRVLRSGPLTSTSNRFAGSDDRLDVLELRAADDLESSGPLPDALAPAPDLDEDDVAVTRRFELAGVTINGEVMDLSRIDETVEIDTTERWVVQATDGGPHSFHVHDTQFAVASIDGEPPPPELAGWKDTVYLPDRREVELLVRFTDYADPDVPYMVHCHLLRHEDQGMMAQFVVVEPGQEAGPVSPGHHDGAH